MHQYVALEDTVYLGFATNLTSGAAGDGASPLFDVRLGGAASGAAPVLSGTPTLLTSGSYSDGCYEVAVAATAANGFAAGNTYLVFVTLTIDSVTPAAMIGSFRISPVPANLTQIGGATQSATDLKDFADDGYDPATNKVQGVVLVDTLTTYTGNTPQTGDSFARIGANGVGLTAVALADTTSDAVLADAIWNAATASYGSAGSYGLLTETNLDAAITSRMASYTQPTGFLAATFPLTVASTTNITAGTITTATNVTTVNGLAANVITAASAATDFGEEIADFVWDEILTGATHNIASSAGRRLRTLQTGGNYEGGMVWIDTIAGVAGTVVDENGTVTNPVFTLADALTLAAGIPLKAFHVANGSTLTLAATLSTYVVQGHEWILALGSQDISGSAFMGANAVTGVSSGTTDVEFEDCIFGNGSVGCTLPPGTYVRCGFNTGSGFPFVGSAAGRYVFVDCYSNISSGGATTPYFTFTGASTVMFRRYSGGANITFDAATGSLTYECLGGGNLAVDLAGSDMQARGTIRDMTLTGIAATTLVEFVGTIGNLSLAGVDGTVTLDGIVGAVVDSRTGTKTLNLPVNTMGIVGNVTGNVSGTVAGVTPSTAAQVAALLTTQITEAYRANGAAPTLAQFMSEVLGHLGEMDITGTTKTVNKFDHATVAETFTLNNATAPTAITRAT